MLLALDALSASEEALDADVLSALELLLLEESVELENPHAAREGAIAAIRRMDTVFFFMIIDSSFCIFTYVREKLEAKGFTGEQLDSVYAPIGIEIGSETPAEIAISIAAQLIQIRSAKTGKRKGAHPALHT